MLECLGLTVPHHLPSFETGGLPGNFSVACFGPDHRRTQRRSANLLRSPPTAEVYPGAVGPVRAVSFSLRAEVDQNPFPGRGHDQ
jgi:hypothetical protein